MPTAPMVRVAVLPTAFEAQLLAARLGCEGVLWELRGNVGGPYPVGPVEVLVRAEDLALASELLLVDEVELALEGAAADLGEEGDEGMGSARQRRRTRMARVGVPVALLSALAASASLLVRLVEQSN